MRFIVLASGSWCLGSASVCTVSDGEKVGSAFGSDFWGCLQQTASMSSAMGCIKGGYPDYDLLTSGCKNCVSKVFLSSASSGCIVACRTDSFSDACTSCRGGIVSRWPTCLSSAGAASLLVAVLISTFM